MGMELMSAIAGCSTPWAVECEKKCTLPPVSCAASRKARFGGPFVWGASGLVGHKSHEPVFP
jgi:hypothetical protein